MNFKAMQDEVIEFRFNENRRDAIQRWINHRYNQLWSAAEWPFKKVGPTNLAVTGSDNTPTMPSDFARVIQLFDDQGNQLRYLRMDEFNPVYLAVPNTTGQPVDYTVTNRQIYLGPTPSGDATYTLTYERALSHFADGSTITAGLLDSDNDEPIWSDEHHYLLVLGAMATGLKMENDPTWTALEEEFVQMFDAMRNDLLPPDHPETLQYGRDNLDREGFAWR